jgi:acyl transferase domain-containing protein
MNHETIMIIDAGICPQSFRGTKTGVFVGFSHYPGTEGYLDEIQPDMTTQKTTIGLRTMSNLKAMLANRISFVFNFKGPSLSTDTACSSSGTAFTLAVDQLKMG